MKKILCLVLSVAMIFSCLSVGMSASALTSINRRPDGSTAPDGSTVPDLVANVIDPILYGKDTAFAQSINEIGYSSVNAYAAGGQNITKGSLDTFLAENADDKMFGVDFDFLYSKDTTAFLWNFLDYKLEVELTDEIINGILGGAATATQFRSEWNSLNLGREFTVHDVEMYAAYKTGARATCNKKGRYDACAEALSGFDYDYSTKATDESIFNGIVESKKSVINPFTGKSEVHYDYAYKFSKGEFGLMRANSNNQFVNVISSIWGDGAIYETPEKATEYAIKIANFIGHLIDPQYIDIPEDTVVFTDSKRMTSEVFFEKVTVLSGLDMLLQAKWCNAKGFDVKAIMQALGVNTDDDVIFDAELSQGNSMGARILSDMYSSFFSDPVGYVTYVIQLFCKNYETLYKKAFNELFSVKFTSMMSKSRYERSKYPELDYYNGTELNTVDGFLGFICDCLYVKRVDAGETNAKKFSFAPMPIKRFSTAADINELYVYVLCYLELNRIYNGNAELIDEFIDNSIAACKKQYKGKDENAVSDLKTVMESMFKGELTFVEIYTFHLGTLTENVIENFPDSFGNTIKRALANFIQNFIDAMDNLMNLLFGWTDGLFERI